jgi:hypothetical protein
LTEVLIASAPLTAALTLGWKATLIVQLCPPARLVGQLLICVKFPLAATRSIDTLALGAAVSIKVWGWLVVPTATVPKLRAPADNFAGAIPVPERLTTCGLEGALSLIVIAPLIGPIVPGLKLTLMVQLALGARLEQLLV